MLWFKRKQKNEATSAEDEKYYEAERRERAGLAWLLSVVTVACVALLVIGLVFGGKWLYNRIKDDDVAVTTEQTETETGREPEAVAPQTDEEEDQEVANEDSQADEEVGNTTRRQDREERDDTVLPRTGPEFDL